MTEDPIESAIFETLAAVRPGASVTPEAVARRLDPEGWRRAIARVKAVAIGLARAGRLEILRKGKPVDPDQVKGVIRLRLPPPHEQ